MDNRSANEKIQDRFIRHQVLLERVKNREVREIVAAINDDTLDEVVDQLAANLHRVKRRGQTVKITNALQEINQRNREIVENGFLDAVTVHKETLAELATAEVAWASSVITESIPVRFDFRKPTGNVLRGIVETTHIRGELISDSFANIAKSTADAIDRTVITGIVEGRTTPQIIRAIAGTKRQNFTDGLLQAPRRHVESAVRTSINHVSAHARELAYEENTELIKGVRYVATLDNRTTIICASLDGKVYDVGVGPRPPQHHNCRSSSVPITKSWKELGIKLKEAPPGTRASLNGQVPENLTFPRWLKQQPNSIQNEVLGKTRARLFRSGKVTIDRFVNNQNQVLSLAELQKIEGIKL